MWRAAFNRAKATRTDNTKILVPKDVTYRIRIVSTFYLPLNCIITEFALKNLCTPVNFPSNPIGGSLIHPLGFRVAVNRMG